MTFTDKDKMLARKYITAGYEWIARGKQNSLYICLYKPTKFALSNYAWICLYSKRIDKRNFKPIQPNSDPIRIDDIIGE